MNTIYLCIHKRLHQQVGLSGVMNKDDFYSILAKLYHIPKTLRPVILQEMIDFNMIENLGSRRNNNIRVKPILFDPEENLGRTYQKAKLF